jgi:hypothetical protein
VLRAPVERVPEGPPAVKPVPVHVVELVEFQESVEDWPWSMVVGEAERVAVGVKALQLGGLTVPLLQTPPVHPPVHATQLVPFQKSGSEQVLQVG